MERYEKLSSQIYDTYNHIYNDQIRQQAIVHTASVDAIITLLAQSRHLDVELAKTAALLHDYATFVDNCPSKLHAALSAQFAAGLLGELGTYSPEEIEAVVQAIEVHSKKKHVHSPLAEVLKDADTFALYIQEPDLEVSAARKARIAAVLAQYQNSPIS